MRDGTDGTDMRDWELRRAVAATALWRDWDRNEQYRNQLRGSGR